MTRLLIAVTAVALLTTSCGDAGPGPSPSTGPKESSSELPEGFPSEVPLPDDAEVLYGVANGPSWTVYLRSDDSQADLVAFMTDRLSTGGWLLTACESATEQVADGPTPAPGASPAPVTTIAAIKGTFAVSMVVGYQPLPEPQFEGPYSMYMVVIAAEEPLPTPETAAPDCD